MGRTKDFRGRRGAGRASDWIGHAAQRFDENLKALYANPDEPAPPRQAWKPESDWERRAAKVCADWLAESPDREIMAFPAVLGTMTGAPFGMDDPRLVVFVRLRWDNDRRACDGIAKTVEEAAERAMAHYRAGTSDEGRDWRGNEARIFGDNS